MAYYLSHTRLKLNNYHMSRMTQYHSSLHHDDLYIAAGSDYDDESTCNIATASLPEQLQSTNRKARSSKV